MVNRSLNRTRREHVGRDASCCHVGKSAECRKFVDESLARRNLRHVSAGDRGENRSTKLLIPPVILGLDRNGRILLLERIDDPLGPLATWSRHVGWRQRAGPDDNRGRAGRRGGRLSWSGSSSRRGGGCCRGLCSSWRCRSGGSCSRRCSWSGGDWGSGRWSLSRGRGGGTRAGGKDGTGRGDAKADPNSAQ